MIFDGENIKVLQSDNKIAELIFDSAGSVNKFDINTLSELSSAIDALSGAQGLKGVVVRSTKPTFIVGADITEFNNTFAKTDEEITEWIQKTSAIFNRFEDLPIPTIAALNGFALGGGFELALACDFRVADTTAQVGLPEIKLGLIPGWGGTVRLPRVIGADNALSWMLTGSIQKAPAALSSGAIDAVVPPELLTSSAISMIEDASQAKLDWQGRRSAKKASLPLAQYKNESIMCFTTAQSQIAGKSSRHYPAVHMLTDLVREASAYTRGKALKLENKTFVQLCKTDSAKAQIGTFLADQIVKSKAKQLAKKSVRPFNHNAVIGAGIMGGGIAYQSAVSGIQVVMKDIHQDALDLGLKEASKILVKGMQRGKISAEKMAGTLSSISATLDYSALQSTDMVIEAVVENPAIKSSVLKDIEETVSGDTVICSNTSTISINRLASGMSSPERFCGMHFFNPVNKMPLVEIIRGEKTNEETINFVVAAALKMGKTPIVVNDCPGFLVNRVLFPYFAAFSQLVLEGVDFVGIDNVMEKEFGWPMGPAYLLDVVGINTADHAANVMSEGIPERLSRIENDPITLLFNNNQLGQKSESGFYEYSIDKRGRPTKKVSDTTLAIIGEHRCSENKVDSKGVIDRLMIPMANEAIRCLEEGVVSTAEEVDMALLYGLGFPAFRGGIFRYIETLGLDNFVALADSYAHLGALYQISDQTRERAKSGQSYFA